MHTCTVPYCSKCARNASSVTVGRMRATKMRVVRLGLAPPRGSASFASHLRPAGCQMCRMLHELMQHVGQLTTW